MSLAAPDSTIESIQEATDTLQKLLDNWEKAVIDCTYADVPRELLQTKNKELLLEKAKTSALFDKSAAVISCKTTNRLVRDYIGRTGKGPVVGLDKKLRNSIDLIDPDDLEQYVQTTEAISQALARADSWSYTAGGDFSSVNNFDENDKAEILRSNNSLQEARKAIESAVRDLNKLLALLQR